MGSTAVLEDAFGGPLAREMLYTGRLLKGRELAETIGRRRVAPRAEVRARALQLAEEMARAPRATLLELRRLVAARRRDQRGPALEREAEAHRRVFALPETARAHRRALPRPAGRGRAVIAVDLQGSTVVVTGGTRGLGRAIGIELARAGASVVLTHRWDSVPKGEVEDAFAALSPAGARGRGERRQRSRRHPRADAHRCAGARRCGRS